MQQINHVLLIDDDPIFNIISKSLVKRAEFSPEVSTCSDANHIEDGVIINEKDMVNLLHTFYGFITKQKAPGITGPVIRYTLMKSLGFKDP